MTKPTTRTQSRRAQRRAAIIEIAAGLVDEHGEANWTTEALAEAADISQASLFYYFRGGRSEIETALALHQNWQLLERIEEAFATIEDGTDALVAILRSMQEMHEDDPVRLIAAFNRMTKGPWPSELIADHIQKVNGTYDVCEALLRADVAIGHANGEISDLRRYIMMVFAAGLGLIMHSSMISASGGDSAHDLGALFDDLADLIVRGTRA